MWRESYNVHQKLMTKTISKKENVNFLKLLAAIVLLALSYLPHLLTPRDYGFWGSLIFGAIYYIGGAMVSDAIIVFLTHKSLIRAIVSDPPVRTSFIKLGLIGAIPFSLAVSTFGGLWYFPHWTATEYYTLGYVLLGWPAYFLFLTVCYQAFKLVLDQIIVQRHPVGTYFPYERRMYKAFGVVGGWAAVMVITVALQDSRWLTNFHISVNSPQKPYLYWYWWLIAVIAWIVLCEFMEYHRKRSSLLKDMLHGYYTPAIAILLCGFSLAITNEFQNLPINLWHYANFPWVQATILNIPLFVVFSWPLQIAAFVEFWRAFGERRATDILFADALQVSRNTKHTRSSYKKRTA
jgi:hypothetical protein